MARQAHGRMARQVHGRPGTDGQQVEILCYCPFPLGNSKGETPTLLGTPGAVRVFRTQRVGHPDFQKRAKDALSHIGACHDSSGSLMGLTLPFIQNSGAQDQLELLISRWVQKVTLPVQEKLAGATAVSPPPSGRCFSKNTALIWWITCIFWFHIGNKNHTCFHVSCDFQILLEGELALL